jgi:hypothetical protein
MGWLAERTTFEGWLGTPSLWSRPLAQLRGHDAVGYSRKTEQWEE